MDASKKMEMARFIVNHQDDYSIKGNRPIYTCRSCGKKKEHEPGDFETARCSCGGTMYVHFSKDPLA